MSREAPTNICRKCPDDAPQLQVCVPSSESAEMTDKYRDSARAALLYRVHPTTGAELFTAMSFNKAVEPSTHPTVKPVEFLAEGKPEHVLPEPVKGYQPATEYTFKGNWRAKTEISVEVKNPDANMFGGFGKFEMAPCSSKTMPIPVLKAHLLHSDFLSLYGARVISINEDVTLDYAGHSKLLALKFHYGREYLTEYAKKVGGGIYAEYHPFAHMAIPTSPACSGSYTLMRKVDDESYAMISVEIDYGFALYVEPNAIHNDSTLIGDYVVVLTDEDDDNVDAVLFRSAEDEQVDIKLNKAPIRDVPSLMFRSPHKKRHLNHGSGAPNEADTSKELSGSAPAESSGKR